MKLLTVYAPGFAAFPGEEGDGVKQPKKPTRAQKEILSKHKLKPDNWMVLEEDKYQIVFISKHRSRRRTIAK